MDAFLSRTSGGKLWAVVWLMPVAVKMNINSAADAKALSAKALPPSEVNRQGSGLAKFAQIVS
jgi:hypothetical protein